MDKMKRGGFFRGMLDNWRYSSSSLGSQSGSTHHSSRDDSKLTSKSDSPLADFEDNLKSEHFLLSEIVRHGFPHNPTCVAFDPIQRLIAIGTRNGCIRIIGRPGVDINVQHVGQFAVIQILFIINEGSLISLCADDSIHLWNIKTKTPSIVHILKFQRERITFAHLPYQSKWLYVGTERGNVHIVNIETFQLSGYVINWNKTIELSRKTHPGSVIHLSDCPIDPSKLLIGYESGTIVLWDLRCKSVDSRVNYCEPLRSISWHHEGRQYLCSHTDGSITTWNVRSNRPVSINLPHAKTVTKDLKPEPCRPIYKVEWKTVKDTDSFIIFTGGLPYSSTSGSGSDGTKMSVGRAEGSVSSPSPSTIATMSSPLAAALSSSSPSSAPTSTSTAAAGPSSGHGNLLVTASSGSTSSDSGSESKSKSEISKSDSTTSGTQSLTVIHGKTTTVLEMEHNIVDFLALCAGTCPAESSDPYAILVLLTSDLVVVDLTSPGYPCFRNPYTMDLHESPITFCSYFADCPTDLIPAFYSVGFKTNIKRPGISEKEWPINGGEWGTAPPSYPELIITGHADGTIKFWDTSSVNLHILYKMKTSKLFQKPRTRPGEPSELTEDPFAIEQIAFCPESRLLCVAGASSHVMMFKFSKHESHSEISVIDVLMSYESSGGDADEATENETTQGIAGLLRPQGSNEDSHGAARNTFYSLLIKSGQHKRAPGFQPELVCLTPWIDENTPPYKITSLALNSSYSLIAYGSENGLVIVDLIQKSLVLNIATADLYAKVLRQSAWLRKNVKTRIKFLVTPLVAASQALLSQAKNNRRDKIDNSFSRSRSSSISSLDNITSEPIQCLTFAESYATKSETSYGPCLWVGTSQGSALSVTITLPETNDNRVLCLQSVLAVASGNVFRLKGSILCISFLDYSGALVGTSGLSDSKTATPTGTKGVIDEKRSGSLTISRSSSSGPGSFNIARSKVSPTSSSTDMKDSQFVVIVSEKQARTISLPSQTCIAKAELSETSFTIRADVIQMKFPENSNSSMCLVTYLATGNIVVYSLPSLKQLIDIDFPSVNVRIAQTISFSTNGHGMYLTSPSEIQKFTIASALKDIIPEMLGNLFVPKEMPEPPKQSFFKGLFSGGPSILDREELFGEAQSGKGSKVVAKHIPGSLSALDHAKLQSGSLASELAKARMGLTERGEHLEVLEEKTARMMNESEGFRNISRQLLNKYENKKWYQF